MELLTEAISIAPRLDYIRRNIASMLVHKGDYEAALIELDTLLTRSPNDPQANLLLGVARYQAGDPALAMAPLTLAFRAGFPDAGMWLLKALCILGKFDEAERSLERLAEDHPERATTLLELELNEPGSPVQHLRDHPVVRRLMQ
jgi:Flp pilus assembly protein TadD